MRVCEAVFDAETADLAQRMIRAGGGECSCASGCPFLPRGDAAGAWLAARIPDPAEDSAA